MFGQSLLSGAFGTPPPVPDENFDTKIYSTATSPNSITGLNFQPDLTWVKSRSYAYSHILADSVRGLGNDKMLISNFNGEEGSTDASNANAQVYGYISSLDSTGFTATSGTSNGSFVGASGAGDYVSWNWKGGGTAVSNGTGSTTSQVSANTAAGFSIATYTGTGSAATFGHGLTSAPEFVLIKSISNTENWFAWSKDLTAYHYELSLNGDGAEYNSAGAMFAAAPTSTLLSIGTDGWVNGSAQEYICYAWHSVAGYSKIGSYTATQTTGSPTITTDFEPKWIMIKNIDRTQEWVIIDSVRGNNPGETLIPNEAYAEFTGNSIIFSSTGFTINASGGAINYATGETMIYMAFA
jgi:hypothetical protein|tara:strand:- start:178 stop:1236 length:1059 start_codon:yes stop_codon:yes gene_type:complete